MEKWTAEQCSNIYGLSSMLDKEGVLMIKSRTIFANDLDENAKFLVILDPQNDYAKLLIITKKAQIFFGKVHGISVNKVVIVSIVGKSPHNTTGLKVKSLGRLFPTKRKESSDDTVIEGSYDEENQIIYLHLYTLLDSDILTTQYMNLKQSCQDKINCDDFISINNEIKMKFVKHMLFLLHISHIVILSHPGYTFDTNFIQYFKIIDSLSKKLFESICDSLKNVENLGLDWMTHGRLCTPRLIFYFERAPKGLDKNSIKKLEHNLEDKIYHILKKTRIISSSGCSLFAIPMNDEYVYISDEQPVDTLGEAVRGLIQDCQPGGAMQVTPPFSSQPYLDKHFPKFLQVHIQQARNKGFDDNVSSSRHQHASSHFELPILKHWIEVCECLYGVIIKSEKSVPCLYTDTRFSEQRCLKVLPLAVARYQEGLSSHYAKSEHDARLKMALGLFRAQARGPMYPQYELQLEMECLAHWQNGRQQCEAASMTGNPCKLPKHQSDQEHMSGFIFKSICDCGRKVGHREDPYTAKQANYLFYQQMAKECQCSKLDRIEFPVFEPSIKEFKAATINETEETSLSVLSDKSVPLTPENDKGLVRQPSTTEYLPGMLTLSSPPGLLPAFPSWSLIYLGASSLYSHNIGLTESHHPSFLSTTNYLLPWDVSVGSKTKSSQKSWSQSSSGSSKYSSRGRKGRPPGTTLPQTVKVFIGIEYECSSGHRFMLAAPDRILKSTPGSIIKDTGHVVAESDMPLYYACNCRASKIAQLMRIHVVTPKAPVHVTLSPRVQPAAGAPIFVPTVDRPSKLTQSAYWVLRLPFAYVADKEHYAHNSTGKLLQGTFGIVEAE